MGTAEGSLDNKGAVEGASEDEGIVEEHLENKGTVGLKRDIGFLYSICLIVGTLVGSGIFISPGSILHQCGSVSLSLAVWIASGILAILVCLCFAELGSIHPRAGGEYSYTRIVLGPLPGFIHAYVLFGTLLPTFFALQALTTMEYFLKPVFMDCSSPETAVRMLAVLILVTMALVNSSYVTYISRVQALLTASKLLALFLIIVGGVINIARGHVGNLQKAMEGTTTNPGSVATAMYSGYFTYGGWQYILQLMEEVKEPEKRVPRASIISLVLVIILYVLTNIAYFTVLSPEQMIQTSAVAVTFAEATYGRLSIIIPFFVACSTIGALNGAMMGSTRVYFAAARDGLFPKAISLINMKFRTPWPSIWLSCFIACFYAVSGNAVRMVEYLGFLGVLVSLAGVSSMLWLRYTQPQLPRPFKVPLVVPIISFIFLVGLMALGLFQNPQQFGVGVIIVICGIPLYWICVSWKRKPRAFNRAMNSINCSLQKMFMLALPDPADD